MLMIAMQYTSNPGKKDFSKTVKKKKKFKPTWEYDVEFKQFFFFFF